jgi:hypothetical protein
MSAARLNKYAVVHGHSATSIYWSWQDMIRRCYDKKRSVYANYGGRGITVCKRWRESFINFYKDMGERPGKGYTLERKENDKGYSKNNCIWATRAEQNRNTRRTRMVTINGETKCIKDWAIHFGISNKGVYLRLRYGWNIEKALTHPIRKFKQVNN